MKMVPDTFKYSAVLLTFIFSFCFFYLCLLLQRLVPNFDVYGSFVPVYLPAGVLFIAILIGGVAGAIGVYLAISINYIALHPNVYWLLILVLMALSISIQYLVIKAFSFFTNIGSNLERLTYLKVLGMAVVFSTTHSLNHHLNLVLIENQKIGWAESKLAISTFTGVFCILWVVWIVSKISDNLMKKNRFFSL